MATLSSDIAFHPEEYEHTIQSTWKADIALFAELAGFTQTEMLGLGFDPTIIRDVESQKIINSAIDAGLDEDSMKELGLEPKIITAVLKLHASETEVTESDFKSEAEHAAHLQKYNPHVELEMKASVETKTRVEQEKTANTATANSDNSILFVFKVPRNAENLRLSYQLKDTPVTFQLNENNPGTNSSPLTFYKNIHSPSNSSKRLASSPKIEQNNKMHGSQVMSTTNTLH